jgi:hypothetical protein
VYENRRFVATVLQKCVKTGHFVGVLPQLIVAMYAAGGGSLTSEYVSREAKGERRIFLEPGARSKLSCGMYPPPSPLGPAIRARYEFDSERVQHKADENLTSSTTLAAPFVFENGLVTSTYLKIRPIARAVVRAKSI